MDRAPVDGGGGLRGAAAEPAWEYNVWRGVQEAVVRDWGGRDFEDIMAGVDELVRRGIADPERLYVGGYSYGAFMSTWVVGHTDRFRAAYVGAPVANQVSMFGTGDIPLFDMHEIGGTPLEEPDEYRARSPVTHLANTNTPVLLLHHEGDLRCRSGSQRRYSTR